MNVVMFIMIIMFMNVVVVECGCELFLYTSLLAYISLEAVMNFLKSRGCYMCMVGIGLFMSIFVSVCEF